MKTAPDPKDVQEFQFKQSNISHILDGFTSIPIACSLLAADKKRGLLYAGQNNKIVVIKPGEDRNIEWKIELKIELNLPIIVSKLMLNCDCTYLAVAPQQPLILIYDAQALARSSLQLLYEIRVSTSNAEVFVSDLRWNPAIPGMLCTVASDHTLGSFKIKEKKEKTIELKALEKFNDIDALCAAWSPKGKQIVVGCRNGSIIQFKPDLKIARTIPGPNPYMGEIVSILWISNYQFCAAYLGREQGINVLIIDAPKGETNAIFTCYEDITYGVMDIEGGGAFVRYYFDFVPEWGLIIAASSSSSEIAVLGTTDKGATWNQWQLVDSGRAELPLMCTTESYPLGLAIDKSPVKRLPWGAESTLPYPVPILHILATSGQLCSFHMVNLTPNCAPTNSPPTEIVASPPQIQTIINDEASLVTNGMVTSTPLPKQTILNVPDRKMITPGNIFDKLPPDSTLFVQPPAEKPKQQEQKPVNIGIEMKLDSPKVQPQETIRPDIKLTLAKEAAQEAVRQKHSVENEANNIRAYLEEHNLFEKELRNRLEPQTWECGTEEERRKLVETTIIIDDFVRELKEATNSLSSDVAYLKALLLQSFAWVEETKSKNAAANDMTRSCGDKNKISDLQKLYYYTQMQLTQASKTLDLEWCNQQSHEMLRMKIPHLEFIYQNLVLHSNIIQKEKSKVDHFKSQWKSIIRSNSILGLNHSLSNMSIASSKSSTTMSRNSGIIEARCKAIAVKTLNFSEEKQNKLKEYLSASTPRVVKPIIPSPTQHRLEETLSTLDSRETTDIETKNKVEQSVSKQISISKEQSIEKPKQQNPLASLNSIVARIGINEGNNVPSQNKQPGFGNIFSPASGNKSTQAEKQQSVPAAIPMLQSIKPKQNTVTFGQVNSPLSDFVKSFPSVDAIPFGTPVQKPEETIAQKTVPKESTVKIGNQTTPNTNTFKLENNIFSGSLLKDALLSDNAQTEKVQTSASNTGLKFGMAIPSTTAKAEAASTFSFVNPTTAAMSVKSTPQNTFAISQTTSAQAFSFASKPSSTSAPFNLKATPSTTAAAPQTQDPLNLTEMLSELQASNQISIPTSGNLTANYKPTFGTAGFQTLLGQAASIGNQVENFNDQLTITKISQAAPKDTVTDTVTTASTTSITIFEKITAQSKTVNLPTDSVQTSSTSSVVKSSSMFGGEISFYGMSTSTPTTSTFTATTVAPAATTNVLSTPLFSGFNTNATSTSSPTATTITTNAVTSFQSTLPRSTFGETPVNLTASSVAPVFGKQTLPMNAQFPSTSTVSSPTNTFGKPVTSPTFKPFASPTNNTSVFGQVPVTTSSVSIFSGNNSGSIFGGNAQPASPVSIFGGASSPMGTFGTSQKSMFDNSGQKTDSIFGPPSNAGTTSFFGGGTNNVGQNAVSPSSTSVFGSTVANPAAQPVLGQQSGFGQASTFGSKSMLGGFGSQTPAFGASPVFVSGFGTMAFATGATAPAFGSLPAMGGNPPPAMDNMPNVFGGTTGGSSTFESLANQSGGLSFSSLAQKTTDAPKPPAFSGGSSFSTWR